MRPTMLAALLLMAGPVRAEVVAATAEGFTSRSEAVLAAAPADVWAALVDWGSWWDPAHSYSGKPGALALEATAGGTLMERWSGGSVQHAEVVTVMPPRQLRMLGGFGPLQALPVQAVLTFALKPEGSGTRLSMTYVVGGPASAALDTLAAPVDSVMSAGFARLLKRAQAPAP